MRRILVLLCVLGCGDDDGDGAGVDAPGAIADAPAATVDAPVSAGCGVEITGAATSTLGCTVTAGKAVDETNSVFGLQASGPGSTTLGMTLRITGTLAVGDHLGDVTGGAATASIGAASYFATKGAENDVGTIGNLQITALEVVSSNGSVTVWAPHGSVSATLVSPLDPDARITFTATF